MYTFFLALYCFECSAINLLLSNALELKLTLVDKLRIKDLE